MNFITGDLHGQLEDLLLIFYKVGFKSVHTHIVFKYSASIPMYL